MSPVVLQVSREGSARPGCVSAGHNQQRLAAGWRCLSRQGAEGHETHPGLSACCFQPLAGLGLGQVRLMQRHSQIPPGLRAQIDACDGESRRSWEHTERPEPSPLAAPWLPGTSCCDTPEVLVTGR